MLDKVLVMGYTIDQNFLFKLGFPIFLLKKIGFPIFSWHFTRFWLEITQNNTKMARIIYLISNGLYRGVSEF